MLNLDSTFGMFEMEIAAKVIIEKQTGQTYGSFTPMYLSDFAVGQEQTGFLELIYGGFLGKQSGERHTYNGGFVPLQSFFDRIENRAGATEECAADD